MNMSIFEDKLKLCENESEVLLLICATLNEEKIRYYVQFWGSGRIYVLRPEGGGYSISMNEVEYKNNELYVRDGGICEEWDVLEFMKKLVEEFKPKE